MRRSDGPRSGEHRPRPHRNAPGRLAGQARPWARALASGISALALSSLAWGGLTLGRLALGGLALGGLASGGCDRSDAASGSSPGAQGGPVAGAKGPTEGALPELSRLQPFSLKNQADEPVTLETYRGKVWAAAFMFTRCPTVCPEITRRMKRVQDGAKERGVQLHLVSFSVDPEHDTPAVLTKYAEEYGADLASWAFLTGEYETIARTAEEGFKVGLSGRPDPNAEHMGITHGSHLVLVDREGVIRGYYSTSEDAALERLLADAARLL